MGQQISNKMHPAALPRRSCQHLSKSRLEAFVGVANDQPDPLQPTPNQAAEKLLPKGLFLAGTDLKTQDFPLSRLSDPNGPPMVLRTPPGFTASPTRERTEPIVFRCESSPPLR
jgi:hypothetical protein